MFAVLLLSATVTVAEPDLDLVRGYVRRTVGETVLQEIFSKEGGKDFLKRFLSDVDWMEQFAGSGPAALGPALRALDLLAWNDTTDFLSTPLGRNAATALALNHGGDYPPEKLVAIVDCYRRWDRDGTLHDAAYQHDVHGWREIMTFGQNARLPLDDFEWIHDEAAIPDHRYGGLSGVLSYRLFNCFGASVHGWQYYGPWQHAWKTQELRYRIGCVCGGISKFCSHAAATHGLRSYTTGQPGHCAYLLWNRGENRWDIHYYVTGHTSPHFSLGGRGFTALEEQERYYAHPQRMAAERLRWKGEYAASMELVPGNWQAAQDWLAALRTKNASRKEWNLWAKAVITTFRTAPSEGWQLFFNYLDALGTDREARIVAARRAFLNFTENPAKTVESMYYDESVLDPLASRFKGDLHALIELLPSMLEGQEKSHNFYQATIAWAATRIMGDPEGAQSFCDILAKSVARTGAKVDYAAMIGAASDNENAAAYQQVYELMDKISPKTAPKAKGRGFPKEDYGGVLLSDKALLRLSSRSSKFGSPVTFRNALDAGDWAVDSCLHTDKEEAPWAMVVFPEEQEVTGLTVVNSGEEKFRPRQIPLTISVSLDGETFEQVYSDTKLRNRWLCALKSPVRAKYVRVGRPENKERKDFFHLHKILVYGKKAK